jgi:hypothetical protein
VEPQVARNAMRPLGTWGAINTLRIRLSVLSSLVTGWWRKCRSNPSLNSFPLLKELAS